MIVWLNGTFGSGKTSVSEALLNELPNARIFDAEEVGFLLRHVLVEPVDDFQDWPPWRSLVVAVITELARFVGGTIIVPQTVLNMKYWQEIMGGLESQGMQVRVFVLHAEPAELRLRIQSDTAENEKVRSWRLAHIEHYEAALPWLRATGSVLDTSHMGVQTVTDIIARALSDDVAL